MSDDYVFNPETGRVGRIQLVVRWVLVAGAVPWPRRHGLFTYATEAQARQHASLCLQCAPEQSPADLDVAAYWAYPQNDYPAYSFDHL